MGILTPERSTTLGGIDSAAIADGLAPSAHLLRELARNANRLISRSELVARFSFDSGGIAGESMGADDLHGWGRIDRWQPITPLVPIERMPWLVQYRALVETYLEADATIYLQVETMDHAFDPAAGPSSPNVITVAAGVSDDWVADVLTLAVSQRRSDHVRLWARSEDLGAMDTGTYGSPASGTLDGLTSFTAGPGLWTVQDSTATWNSGGSTPTNGGHLVRLIDAFGNIVVPYTQIRANTGTTLQIYLDAWAGIPFGNGIEWIAAQAAGYCDYEIVKTPTWRLGDFALYGLARTP